MTPRQLNLLTKAHKRKVTREESYIGLLASVSANFSSCPPKEQIKPSDFFSSLEPKEEPMTDEELTLRALEVLSK